MTLKKEKSRKKKVNFDLSRTIIDTGKIDDRDLLLDACPYPLIIVSVDGYITLNLNQEAAKIFNKSKKELIGTSIMPLLDLNAIERRRQVIHRVIELKKPYILEDFDRNKWWRTLIQPIQNKNREVIKIAVLIQNITKKKQDEKQRIEKNDEFWTRIIEYTNNIFFVVDKEGSIRYVSESVRSIAGYDPKKIINTNLLEYVHSEDKQRARSFFIDIIKENKIKSLTHRFLTKKGSILHMETTANNLLTNPIFRGIIITTHDVSKTHKAQIETKQIKTYLENIINSTSDIIFSLDTDNKVIIWNTQAIQITGYTSKSICGKNIFSIPLIQDKIGFKSYLKTCYKKVDKPTDVKIKTKHDDYRLLRIRGSLVKTKEDTVKGIVFTGRDVTSDPQIHGRLVTGLSYLILDEDNSKAIDLMNSLLFKEYKGLLIGRDVTIDLFNSSKTNQNITTYYFSQEKSSNSSDAKIISNPSTMSQILTDFFKNHKKTIALIDRLDYFITLHGFQKVMQTIYDISSITAQYNGIVLIRLNPEVLVSNELAILHEELYNLPEQNVDNISIDKKLFDILDYVEQKNLKKSLVSYKNISKHFSITKVTTAKRLSELSDNQLIVVKKRGRLKTIHITNKGKRLLQKRSVV